MGQEHEREKDRIGENEERKDIHKLLISKVPGSLGKVSLRRQKATRRDGGRTMIN